MPLAGKGKLFFSTGAVTSTTVVVVAVETDAAGTGILELQIPMTVQQIQLRVVLPLVHRPTIGAVTDLLLVEEEEVVAEDVVIDVSCR